MQLPLPFLEARLEETCRAEARSAIEPYRALHQALQFSHAVL